mmetsp:Transcript_13284/g.37522  ORF Transcript_13284/g.37522 Transcript_13284/m.37522 type:complete len:405 (+) Transcript_13284:129-1343(+)
MAATTPLSQAFLGGASQQQQEGPVPGTGGNLQTVYEGWGQFGQPMPGSDSGYKFGEFPAGRLPSGAERQEFRISDSTAFNNLRGIAKTSFPFAPYPAQDHPNQEATALTDNFQQSDVGGVSSLLPGKFSYNNTQGSLGKEILQEFEAGTSTYNSLPWAESGHAITNGDAVRMRGTAGDAFSGARWQNQEGINPQSIVDQFREAFVTPMAQDVPLTPFHKTYPNFGSGQVDYGFSDPGADKMSDEIIRAYHAVLPEGQLAGTKKELMPVFSGINQEALDPRPVMQSLGKMKNTLYLGGVTELPDELRIDPRQSLLSGSNIPTGVEQTAGELSSALDTLGFYRGANGLTTGNPYGLPLQPSRTLAGTAPQINADFYAPATYMSEEPLVFGSGGAITSSTESAIMGQ